VRLYLEVVRTTARRMATYRGATLAGVFTNTVFGFLLAYVLIAVFRERGTIGDFDAVDAVTFTFVAQGLAMPVGVFGNDAEQSQRILTGDVAMDLCRPYDYQGWWGAVAYGKALFYLWARGIPPILVAALAFDLRVPGVDEWWIFPAFALAVVLAIGVAFAFRFLVQMVAFWIVDVRGPNQVAWIVGGFLSGMWAPLVLFPDSIEPFVRVLPFASMIGLPIEVFLGMHSGASLTGIYALQAAWLVALLGLGRVVLARADRKLVIAGG
jgi:ABC-2 type transport system permease protein